MNDTPQTTIEIWNELSETERRRMTGEARQELRDADTSFRANGDVLRSAIKEASRKGRYVTANGAGNVNSAAYDGLNALHRAFASIRLLQLAGVLGSDSVGDIIVRGLDVNIQLSSYALAAIMGRVSDSDVVKKLERRGKQLESAVDQAERYVQAMLARSVER